MMKLGLHTAILAACSFEQVVDYAASVGFKTLEVCCWPNEKAARRYAGVSHIDVDGMTRADADRYMNYAREKGIEIGALAYFPNPMSDDAETGKKAREHLLKVIDAAALMGVNLVTTFLGKDKTKTVEENLDLMDEIWPPILRHAQEKGVRIAIETAPCSIPGMNGREETIWRERPRYGDGCWPWAAISESALTPPTWFCREWICGNRYRNSQTGFSMYTSRICGSTRRK